MCVFGECDFSTVLFFDGITGYMTSGLNILLFFLSFIPGVSLDLSAGHVEAFTCGRTTLPELTGVHVRAMSKS